MGYVGTTLRDDVTIDELFTLHYFEYTKGFSFKGESHDFWEMVYVDKGEVIVTAGEREMTLSHGDAFFHHPNQWHNVRSRNAANTVILSFRCSSPVMDWFYDRRLKAGNLQKTSYSQTLGARRIATIDSSIFIRTFDSFYAGGKRYGTNVLL